MKTAILFGANGQDGFYLRDLLLRQGFNVIGVSRSGDFLRTPITDLEAVRALIRETQPDVIFHLAANSTTRHDVWQENHETISTGTFVILEAVRLEKPNCKVFISGSGLQFENHDQPIRETDPFEARDPYSVSRIQSVYCARYYRRLGVQAYVGYFFNHDSPRRSERHMAQKIAAFARQIKAGQPGVLEIGDMDVVKEWTFAGDVVQGIWTLVQQDQVMEANLGSGLGYSIRDWLDVCFAWVGKDWQPYIQLKPGFKPEYRQLVSDSSRIHQLGWKPTTSLADLARMMLETQAPA